MLGQKCKIIFDLLDKCNLEKHMNSTDINVTARKSQSRPNVIKLIELDRQESAQAIRAANEQILPLTGGVQ
jgi:hypothetical protein